MKLVGIFYLAILCPNFLGVDVVMLGWFTLWSGKIGFFTFFSSGMTTKIKRKVSILAKGYGVERTHKALHNWLDLCHFLLECGCLILDN